MSNDLRAVGEKIINISRLLHDHTHKLEVAVEGTYANESSDTLEFDKVLQLVMEQVIRFVKAESGFLALINPVTTELEFTIALDRNGKTIDRSAYRNSRSTVGKVIRTREPVLTGDAMLDDALK